MRKLSALIVACWLTVAPVAASAQVLDQGFINAGTACTTTGACVSAVVGQASSVTIQIVGTFSATLSFEATADGSTWVAAQVQNLADGTISTSTTAAGAFSLSNVGVQRVRVRASAYTSGGAQVTFVRGYGMVRWQGFSTLTVTDAIIVGSATTSGIRLDVSSGVFRVREGDNSADGPMSAGAATFSGAIGVNHTSPEFNVQMRPASFGQFSHTLEGYGVEPSYPVYYGRRARGTVAEPSAVQSGDHLLVLAGRGYGTDAFLSTSDAAVFFSATENYTNTAHGTAIDFEVTPTGSTSRARAARIGSGFFAVGVTPAASGVLRLPSAVSIYFRNAANSSDLRLLEVGQDGDTNGVMLGSGSGVTKIRTALSAPVTPSSGDWWVECTGTSPSRVCAIKVYDGGAIRTIASMTY